MERAESKASDALDRLPHGEPFRFLTRVVSLENQQRGVGEWALSGAEDFFRGHFPGEPVVPGVLLTEAAAQLCGLVAWSDENQTDENRARAGGRLGGVRLAQSNMKFPAAAVPPTTIVLSAEFERAVGPLRLLRVRAESGGVVVAEGTIMLAAMRGATSGEEGSA